MSLSMPPIEGTDVTQALDSQSGTAQRTVGMSVTTFLASMATAMAEPRTYLVPDHERTEKEDGRAGPFQWVVQVLRTKNKHFIEKCGLDAYFFLRYLRMLLKIFVPLALLILPILLPLNKVGGKDTNPVPGARHGQHYNVTGFDQLAWGNIRPENTGRYWAHLILALVVILYVCFVFFDELRDYVRMRQQYMTSPEHRLRASATTVLVNSIPEKWLSVERLEELFDVYPGGIRNIWINRNMDELSEKVKERTQVALDLEMAETRLIQICKKAQMRKAVDDTRHGPPTGRDAEEIAAMERRQTEILDGRGHSAGNPHQIAHSVFDAIYGPKGQKHSQPSPQPDHTVTGSDRMPLSSDFSDQPTVVDADNRARFVTLDLSPPATGSNGACDSASGQDSPGKSRDDATSDSREYPVAYDETYCDSDYGEPLWKRYIKPEDRETMRLPVFGISWMPSLPLLGQKVDKIEHLRKELARLNLEIEIDQENPEKFPLMSSAFVQFNHQVAAHMACQSIAHHVPNHMTPRMVEISPDDVIWENMSLKWWESYIRTFGVLVIVAAMIIGWAFPVAFTGLLSQLSYLETKFAWLAWIGSLPTWVLSAVQGLLPPLLLSVLMAMLPIILRFLSKAQGNRTGMAVELTVQKYYFAFLFVQLFLIVSISSSFSTMFRSVTNFTSIPALLAQNIPRASNYFFSYMVLQALSVSAGALVQIVNLISWFILAPIIDKTARMKFARTMNLQMVQWGTFFPVYTTLASIGLIYCIVSPLIMVFNVLTFSLFWFVYRYNTLYVTKFRFDTGGLLFPTAINQLFTGLYIMEGCLIGLFFLVRDQHNRVACQGQAIIMIVVFILTTMYQWLLNKEFHPLFRYIPMSIEDDACRREEEFFNSRSLACNEKRRGVEDEVTVDHSEENQPPLSALRERRTSLHRASTRSNWADRLESRITRRRSYFFNHSDERDGQPNTVHMRQKLERDLEAQAAAYHEAPDRRRPHTAGGASGDITGAALFEGIHTGLADLTVEERDKLVQRAFQHEALRMKRPVVWIPRDDLGVSDDEVFRTQMFSKHIWISNEYAALDGKCRTIFSRSPPDFSEVDLIQL
ncbi:hypothetical protein KEM52_002105 [Ascosphaera acerosa]|nr:hypothetical protein KEM52_002105 [Ascosphaera acerosa]